LLRQMPTIAWYKQVGKAPSEHADQSLPKCVVRLVGLLQLLVHMDADVTLRETSGVLLRSHRHIIDIDAIVGQVAQHGRRAHMIAVVATLLGENENLEERLPGTLVPGCGHPRPRSRDFQPDRQTRARSQGNNAWEVNVARPSSQRSAASRAYRLALRTCRPSRHDRWPGSGWSARLANDGRPARGCVLCARETVQP
jgi:hypothetical protein